MTDGVHIFGWGDMEGLALEADHGMLPFPVPLESMEDAGKIVKVSVGEHHIVVLNIHGEVLTCGDGSRGQLGMETDFLDELTRVDGLASRMVDVAAGGEHTLAVSEVGYIYAWGRNDRGQCGHGHCRDVSTPLLVGKVKDKVFGRVEAGKTTSVAITTDGMVFVWGTDYAGDGRLGLGMLGQGPRWQLVPQFLPTFLEVGVEAVALGAEHSAAISRGALFMFGCGSVGQLGTGNLTSVGKPTKVPLPEDGDEPRPNVVQVALGLGFTVALTDNGHVFTCGLGLHGELGQGDEHQQSSVFERVHGLATKNVVSIAAGPNYCCAVTDAGHLYVWGAGQASGLGLGTRKDRARPVRVGTLQGRNVVGVCGGAAFAFVFVSENEPIEEPALFGNFSCCLR